MVNDQALDNQGAFLRTATFRFQGEISEEIKNADKIECILFRRFPFFFESAIIKAKRKNRRLTRDERERTGIFHTGDSWQIYTRSIRRLEHTDLSDIYFC